MFAVLDFFVMTQYLNIFPYLCIFETLCKKFVGKQLGIKVTVTPVISTPSFYCQQFQEIIGCAGNIQQ